MKRIVMFFAVAVFAAMTVSCERTKPDDEPKLEGGRFEADGISADYKYAVDYCEYSDDAMSYEHSIIFSDTASFTGDGELDKGVRLEAMILTLYTFEKDLELSVIPVLSVEHDWNGDIELPFALYPDVAAFEGSDDPTDPYVIYDLSEEPGKSPSGKYSVVIQREGENYRIEIPEIELYDENGKAIKGSFSYVGPITRK